MSDKLEEAKQRLNRLIDAGTTALSVPVSSSSFEQWECHYAQVINTVFCDGSVAKEALNRCKAPYSIALLTSQMQENRNAHELDGAKVIAAVTAAIREIMQHLTSVDIRDELVASELSATEKSVGEKIALLEDARLDAQSMRVSAGWISETSYKKWHQHVAALFAEFFGSDSTQYSSFVAPSYLGIGHDGREQFSRQLDFKQKEVQAQLAVLYQRKKREPKPKNRGKNVAEESTDMKKVFLVHGHDHQTMREIQAFMQQKGLKVVVLQDLPSQGKTLIEKLEHHAKEVGFAVILYTDDDYGVAKREVEPTSSGDISVNTLNARARQNIVLETGWFYASIGREKTLLIRSPGVELPSDVSGVEYTPNDPGWKNNLVEELVAAGLLSESVAS